MSFSYAICKIDYRELEHYLTITRCYAINRDIVGDLSGEYVPFCQIDTAQPSGDTRKKTNKGLRNEKVLRRRVGTF